MSLEGYMRRAVWLWREEPELVKKIARAVLLPVVVYTVGRYIWQAPAAKPRKHAKRDKIRSDAIYKGGMVLPSWALGLALRRASRVASAAGILQPLTTADTILKAEGEFPFLITLLDEAALKRKEGQKNSIGAALRSIPQAMGLPYYFARARVAFTEPDSTFGEKLWSVWGAYFAATNSGHRLLYRAVTKVARFLGLQGRGEPSNDAFASPLPIETFVCNLSATHSMVLNKFNIFESHGVIVTRAFERQTDALTEADMHALWRCVSSIGGLGFFNCGPESGSSQPRKHTQFVPFESIRNSSAGKALAAHLRASSTGNGEGDDHHHRDRDLVTPLDVAVRQYQRDHTARRSSSSRSLHSGDVFSLPAFKGLRHGASMLGGDLRNLKAPMAARRLLHLYRKLLARAAMGAGDDSNSPSSSASSAIESGSPFLDLTDAPAHNLILTPTYMLVVLRSKDKWKVQVPAPVQVEQGAASGSVSVPVNALAYCGFLLAKSGACKEAIVDRFGPLDVLRKCAVPTPAAAAAAAAMARAAQR